MTTDEDGEIRYYHDEYTGTDGLSPLIAALDKALQRGDGRLVLMPPSYRPQESVVSLNAYRILASCDQNVAIVSYSVEGT